jgi:putative ABC transport system permease protein
VNDRIVPDAPAPPASAWRTVVGISPTIRQGSAQDAYLSAVVYIPYRQDSPGNASVLIHSPLPPAAVIDAVRREVQAVDPDQPVFAIKTIAQLLAEDRWLQRTFGSMFAVFAVIALVLSSVGLYAVMAYSVAQRTQEIGIRMAIGAQQVDVLWLIVKRGLVQLTIGLPLGLAGALALGVALQRMLVEITPGDPATFAGITALLAAVSAAACLLPARRAARIDPMVALRTE